MTTVNVLEVLDACIAKRDLKTWADLFRSALTTIDAQERGV